MYVLEGNTVKSDNILRKNIPFVIGAVAILIIAAGIFFASRITDAEETPHEYNGHIGIDTNDILQTIADDAALDDYDYINYVNTEDEQARNLLKLSKVWGFAKYTHQAFLLGERCWDEELLALITVVRFADEDDVNHILYNWFIGLGDDGYDLDYSAFRAILLENFPVYHEIIVDFFEDTSNHNWPSVEGLHEELWLLNTDHAMNLHPTADMSWIHEDYLGVSLATALSRFNKVQVSDRGMSPVYFDSISNSVFTNKERFVEIDYADDNYRLLGLFRLWTTIKYFFPYLDIIDYDWSELLLEYIPKMLEGSDRSSYEVVLVTLASKLQDAHIHFFRGQAAMGLELLGSQTVDVEIITSLFGRFFAPVILREAEGHLVVSGTNNTDLYQGDVILRVNDTDIGEITAAMLQYLPFPNADKALAYLVRDHIVLRQHSDTAPMAIDVCRFGEELRIYVNTVAFNSHRYVWRYAIDVSFSHMILENNIGLINPSRIMGGELHRNSALSDIMNELENANINGLIIDWRQGTIGINYLLAEYLFEEYEHFITMSRPFGHVPGVFVDDFRGYSGLEFLADFYLEIAETDYDFIGSIGSFFHNQNIVLLMNERTQSHTEFTIMTLWGGANVTVMGTNSIGANGNVVFLPLPGRLVMMYTGLGVYTPDGGQTQRIGLSPDIYVPRTIAGISEGRDELMEAAIQFLREQMPQNE
ncbi:MAG: S41 family peptidase [Defluviitaleaceae bacterium]|nr:S41 family peptidase [Defluviitaleaceae bacterium]